MRYTELTETTRNLGGFDVKVIASVPSGAEQEVDEQGMAEDDDAVAAFLARGGEIQRFKPAKPRKGEGWQGSAHIGSAGGRGNTKGRVSGLGANTGKSGKPVVTAEGGAPVTHRIGLTVTDPNHPMVSKRKETYQKSVRVTSDSREAAINSAIAHHKRKGYRVHDHHYLGTVDEVDEAIKIDAPQKSWSRQDMQDYLTRIKTGTKTKQDRFKPIIHGSNVKAITKNDGNEEWDLDDLARQITTRPRAILGTNAKMAKSKIEGSITYDLTLPALSGIVVDEETSEFVEITTCPGAGECQLYCYARKGGYVMFPASSMSAAQALNFLVNHPEDYMKMFDTEVKKAKALATKNGIKLLVRVHDAGDFFSKEYYDLVMGVKAQNPDCKFYFYTKMGDIASADQPDDVIGQFSPGAKSREVKTVQVQRDAGRHVKDAVTLPKDMFRELFVTDAKGKYVKDEKGRTQVKSEADWNQFKQKLADIYKLDVGTIVTYDEMNRIPEGPKPKWNVVVFPAGHGDLGASRLDVSKQFLMFH